MSKVLGLAFWAGGFLAAWYLLFFGVSGYLQHRMRCEPEPEGGADLLTSLDSGITREDWILAQLGVGRAVTLLTLAAIALFGWDHLRFFASTPAQRLWALLGITLIVLAILAWNLVLTRQAKRRKRRLDGYLRHLCVGPESRGRGQG